MSDEAKLISEMLHPGAEAALKAALERFYRSDQISEIWPSAVSDSAGGRLPLSDVDIIVLPLDRIGAPAGASGAGVYVAYYSHKVDAANRHAASQPMVVKIGEAGKLREERDGALKWPMLNSQQKVKFAFPLYLDEDDADRAILIAPFQSLSKLAHGGSRNDVEVRDLWRLLDKKEELSPSGSPDWIKISALVAQALDAMEPAHRAGRGQPLAADAEYAAQYDWHLRKTAHDGAGSTKYIPTTLFGDDLVTVAFGSSWPNPTAVVQRIVKQRMRFNGILGPVHGDLHPKNIVLDEYDAVQIIDFGWATIDRHIVMDYVLLDLNLRGTTLPSQISEEGILQLAGFLKERNNPELLHAAVRGRARIIRDVIWHKARQRAVESDWEREYLIPLFLVGYGLLVHLDNARNQPALVATVLQLAKELDGIVPPAPPA